MKTVLAILCLTVTSIACVAMVCHAWMHSESEETLRTQIQANVKPPSLLEQMGTMIIPMPSLQLEEEGCEPNDKQRDAE